MSSWAIASFISDLCLEGVADTTRDLELLGRGNTGELKHRVSGLDLAERIARRDGNRLLGKRPDLEVVLSSLPEVKGERVGELQVEPPELPPAFRSSRAARAC